MLHHISDFNSCELIFAYLFGCHSAIFYIDLEADLPCFDVLQISLSWDTMF